MILKTAVIDKKIHSPNRKLVSLGSKIAVDVGFLVGFVKRRMLCGSSCVWEGCRHRILLLKL